MTKSEFNRRIAAMGTRSICIDAARAVLVEGRSINGAARDRDLSPTLVMRLVHRIRDAEVCGECGQVRRRG